MCEDLEKAEKRQTWTIPVTGSSAGTVDNEPIDLVNG